MQICHPHERGGIHQCFFKNLESRKDRAINIYLYERSETKFGNLITIRGSSLRPFFSSHEAKTVKHEYPLLQLSLPFETTHQTEVNHF